MSKDQEKTKQMPAMLEADDRKAMKAMIDDLKAEYPDAVAGVIQYDMNRTPHPFWVTITSK